MGAMIGMILGAVDLLTASNPLPDQLLTVAYAAVLILISAPFLRSTLSGLVCGIIALVTETTLGFLYLVYAYGIVIATYTLPYPTLLLYLIITFPLAGALAGYLGRKL